MSRLLWGSLIAIAGCVGSPARDTDHAALVGTADPSYPEVGVLVTSLTRGGQRVTKTCTATLVTDRVVVTARHCLPDAASPCDTLFATSTTGDFELPALRDERPGVARGQAIVRPDGVGEQRMTTGVGRGMLPGDLAAVVLDRALPLPARGMRRGPTLSAADAGAPIRLIGVGKSPWETATRRMTRSAVEALETAADGLLTTVSSAADSAVRPGDSGGPVLLETPAGDKLLVGVITAQFPSYSLHTALAPWDAVLREATDRAAAEAPVRCAGEWRPPVGDGARSDGAYGPASDEEPALPADCGCDPGCTERGDCCDGCWSCGCDDACGLGDVPCCSEGCW